MSFDLRQHSYLSPILNQGSCNSCWAYTTAQCFSDRLKLYPDYLDPKHFLRKPICNFQDYGYDSFHNLDVKDFCSMDCSGGFLQHCHLYLLLEGLPSISNPRKKYKAKNIHQVTTEQMEPLEKRKAIMQELHNGPVSAGFHLLPDFNNGSGFINKIYSSHGYSDDGHAVAIIGWGKGYWICRNSMGRKFGEDGYFKMKMGVCGIEDDVWAIEPF